MVEQAACRNFFVLTLTAFCLANQIQGSEFMVQHLIPPLVH